MTAKDAMRVYDLLREAHKSIKEIWREFPSLIETDRDHHLEIAIDSVDSTLYLAEHTFVKQATP